MDKRFLLFIVILSVGLFGIKAIYHSIEPPAPTPIPRPTTVSQPVAEQAKQPIQAPQAGLPLQQEEHYILENEFQQLVFSNIGGALVEINLPFRTRKDTSSVVLPITFDREMLQESPKNARFPLLPAHRANGSIDKGVEGGYYPLLRRSQLLKTKETIVPPEYYGLNIVSQYPELASLKYEVKKFTDQEIIFEATQPFRKITKRFSFFKDMQQTPYCLQLEIKIEGDSSGLFLTSGVPEVEWISGAPAPTIKYHIARGNTSKVEVVDLPKDVFSTSSVVPDWVVNSNGFFGVILDPSSAHEMGFKAQRVSGTVDPSRLVLLNQADRFVAKDLPGYNVLMPVAPQKGIAHFRIFAGPFADSVLTTIDNYFAAEQGGRDSNYLACQTFHGWFAFISEPFAKFLFFLMKFFYSLFHSWALSIILITVVLRVLLYPLNAWSLKSTKAMQLVAPKIKAIQEKYKKEPQKAQMEILNIYRQHRINPLSGCLPLLIQMPFLIGMFDLLKSAFELRGASFIPGWINDLSAPDVLFSWNYSIPFIGNQFHLLPIILGGIMFLQQNMSASLPKNPAEWTDQQRQQRSMGTIMTIVLTVMFYQFPSGLNIYWISSMLLSMAQQWWTTYSTVPRKLGTVE